MQDRTQAGFTDVLRRDLAGSQKLLHKAKRAMLVRLLCLRQFEMYELRNIACSFAPCSYIQICVKLSRPRSASL